MTALARDLQRMAAAREAGFARQERRSFLPPRRREPAAFCPVCSARLAPEDELAYSLQGAARGDCLGCEHCAGLDALDEPANEHETLLRYTAWEVDELWH